MMLRLVALDLVPLASYMARRSEWTKKAAPNAKGGTHYAVVLSRNGERYSRLVIDAYQRGILTGHRASTYMGTSIDGLDRIAEELAKKGLRRAS